MEIISGNKALISSRLLPIFAREAAFITISPNPADAENPSNTIIFSGGPNIDYDTDSKIKLLKEKNYLDYYIIDAGEVPFNDLITWILNDKKDQMPNNLMCLNQKHELVESSKNILIQ